MGRDDVPAFGQEQGGEQWPLELMLAYTSNEWIDV